MELVRPLFIVGYPRSGTTLLRSILNQHSAISVVNEPELIFAFRSAGFTCDTTFAPAERRKVLEGLKRFAMCRRYVESLPEPVVDRFLHDTREFRFPDLYELFVGGSEKPVWGEKSLNGLFVVDSILEMYPAAVVVHLVRDPRSAALSRFKKRFHEQRARASASAIAVDEAALRGRTALWEFCAYAQLWSRWMTTALHWRRELSGENWMEIRFEDFVSDPRTALEPLCRALGVAFEESMLDSARRSGEAVAHTHRYAHAKVAEAIDPSRSNAFAQLPKSLIWAVERETASTMGAFGYEPLRPLVRWQEAARARFQIEVGRQYIGRLTRSQMRSEFIPRTRRRAS